MSLRVKSSRFQSGLFGTTALVATVFLGMPQANAAALNISTAGNTTQTLGAGDTLTVTGAGTITDEPGVVVDSVAATSLSNAGGITAASGQAVFMSSGSFTGAFTNSGTIESSLSTTTTATVTAIYMNNSSVGGAFTNSGTIHGEVNATTSSNVSAFAYGLRMENGSTLASLTNNSSGTISATAVANATNSSQATAEAYAIYINNSDITGTLSNAGHITATATATATSSGSALAYALYADTATIGTFTNTSTGVIKGSAHAEGTNSGNSAEAYGVYFDTVDVTNGVTNSGTLWGNAEVTGTSYAYSADARGYFHDTGTIASFTNNSSGVIKGTASARIDGGGTSTGYAYGYGLYLDTLTVTGDLNNAGTILGQATGVVTHSTDGYIYGYAYGAYLTSTDVGSITNTGSIRAVNTIDGPRAYATEAYGLYASNGTIGSLTNSGTISSTATVTADYSDASADDVYGLYFNTITMAGTFNNSGTISATGTATTTTVGGGDNSASASAYGAYINGSTLGAFTNSGTISATATASSTQDSATATATGLYFSGGAVTGAFTNTGTIRGTATANSTVSGTWASAEAYGLYSSGTDYGSFSNSGTISGVGTAYSADSQASASTVYGAYISGATITGAFMNSGTISGAATATAESTSSAYGYAYGLYMSGSTAASFTNSGIIRATATSEADEDSATATAYGFYANNFDVAGAVTNSGTISATATATANDGPSSASVTAYGMYIAGGSVFGSMSNTGTIKATATATATGSATATADAYGMYISNAGSDFTAGFSNSGTIMATASASADTGITASATAYGLYISGGANIAGGITNSGTIKGIATDGTTNNAYGVYVTGSQISGGLTNTGIISSNTGTAISLNGLTGATPINLNGGRVIGSIIDNAPNTGFSVVTVGGTGIYTEGDWTVSDMTVSAGKKLTISAGDTVTLNNMSTSAGEIEIEVNSGTDHGMLTVNGAGNDLDFSGAGGLPTIKVGTGDIANGDEILIADGAAAITGGPGAVLTDVTDNSFLWSFQVADGTAATVATDNTDLFLFVNQANTISGSATTTANANVGNMLQSLSSSTNPQIQQLLQLINGASTQDELNDVLEAILPDLGGGALVGALNITNTSLGMANGRLSSLRTGDASGMSTGTISKGVKMWGQVFGSTVDQDRRDGIAGFESDTYGVAVGIDSENVADRAVLGVALSYANTDVDSDATNRASADVDSYQLTLYGDYDIDERTYLSGMLAYGHHNNDTTREPGAGLVANGEFDANQFTARAEVGRDYQYESTTLTPNFMAHWTHYDPDSYTETGAGGAGMNIDGDDVDIFELGLGVTAGWEHQVATGGILKPELNAGYRYDLVGDKVTMTNQFIGGGGTFKSEGFDPAQSTFDIGASLTYFDTSNWELTADYDYEFKSDYGSHSGFVRAAYKF